MYSEGRGVEKDHEKAFEWVKKAAEQGYTKAQKFLAYMYLKGLGVSQSDAQASRWFNKSK